MKLPVMTTNHLKEQFSTAHQARVILTDNFKDHKNKAIFVFEISNQKCKAFDSEINDVFRLVLITQKRDDFMNND